MANAGGSKARLIELIAELSVVRGRVTLASGIEADYYIDLRKVTLHHEAAPLIGEVMLALLAENGISDFDAVGGLTMGADPVATAMLHQASQAGKQIDAFVVRKSAKQHGLAKLIEGPEIAGKRVVVVEDTSTTGGSPLSAATAASEAGAEVLAVITVVDRATGAKEKIEAAGFRYLSAIAISELDL